MLATSIEITMSAPISRASLSGRLFLSPPSIEYKPFSTWAGVKTAGMEMLALTAFTSEPLLNISSLPEIASVPIALNGIGSLSKSVIARTLLR